MRLFGGGPPPPPPNERLNAFFFRHIEQSELRTQWKATEIADSLKEGKELDLDRRVAVYIAFLAVLLSICSVGGGNASKDATRTNIEAPDTWAFFQAKNQRQTAYKLATDGLNLRLSEPSLPDATRKAIDQKLVAYQAEIAHLESDPEKGEGKKELIAKAKEFEKARDTTLRQDPYFDYAEALLQIGIVLASASIVLKNSSLLWGSGFLSFVGFLLMLNGFTLAVTIPFIECRGHLAYEPSRGCLCHGQQPAPSNPPGRGRDGRADTHRKARYSPDPP